MVPQASKKCGLLPPDHRHIGIAFFTSNGSNSEQILGTFCVLQELNHEVNVFDPWARNRGEYYSLHWKTRPGEELDLVKQLFSVSGNVPLH